MLSRIHINQHNIKANAKGASLPVVTVKDYKRNRKCDRANIVDSDGSVLASIVYSPNKPLNCGARVWIETECDVVVEQGVK